MPLLLSGFLFQRCRSFFFFFRALLACDVLLPAYCSPLEISQNGLSGPFTSLPRGRSCGRSPFLCFEDWKAAIQATMLHNKNAAWHSSGRPPLSLSLSWCLRASHTARDFASFSPSFLFQRRFFLLLSLRLSMCTSRSGVAGGCGPYCCLPASCRCVCPWSKSLWRGGGGRRQEGGGNCRGTLPFGLWPLPLPLPPCWRSLESVVVCEVAMCRIARLLVGGRGGCTLIGPTTCFMPCCVRLCVFAASLLTVQPSAIPRLSPSLSRCSGPS